MKLRLVRHATLQIEYAGRKLLVDPMFAAAGAFRSLTAGESAGRNPTVPLLGSADELLDCEAVLVSHLHFDHLDGFAISRLDKKLPIFCQPADLNSLRRKGFARASRVESNGTKWDGIEFFRTGGQHGRGLLGRLMGPVSGFVLKAENEPTLYITGDTVWCPEVRQEIERHQPDVIVVNAGAAQFNLGAPITMTAQGVVEVCRTAPDAKIVAVHMEAINHCRLTRSALRAYLEKSDVSKQVEIPKDGESITYQKE
jgi:L-ascorbate metabolism protein UlaG (beta-lactamase superfamily)